MTSDELLALADQATPGPWEYADLEDDEGFSWPVVRVEGNAWIAQGEGCFTPEQERHNLRLIALAPSLARDHAALLKWAERAAEALRDLGACDDPNCNEPNCLKLLAEFDVLRERP